MKLQTRLFLGTAALVMAVTVCQWWLHRRQVDALRAQLGEVAASVGRGLLGAELPGAVQIELAGEDGRGAAESGDSALPGLALPSGAAGRGVGAAPTGDLGSGGSGPPGGQSEGSEHDYRFEWVATAREEQTEVVAEIRDDDGNVVRRVERFEIRVDPGEEKDQRFLVVSAGPGMISRVPIPVAPTVQMVQRSSRQALAAGAGVLLLGLVGAAVMARRVAAPLQRLAVEADALGRGARGVRVPDDGWGEVGELQRAFNRMSSRLGELEREQAAWREREHLAQLGDIARGLAHTVRNPLNTLGLAVEELAGGAPERRELVSTARGQIRRIDRWLRSFLAVGANGAVTPEPTDLGDLAREVVLEAVQQGAEVELVAGDDPLPVRAVPGALRAAVANLVENAVHASPAGEAVTVAVGAAGDWAEIRVRDRGPGLPGEVRERLWAPHVTTRPEGSGMGLYLARQLVVSMHGGTLELEDAPGGGTVAVLRLARAAEEQR